MDFFIRYTCKADQVATQQAAIKTFMDHLKSTGDEDYRYTSYKHDDGVSFTHHAWMKDEDAFKRFQGSDEFKAFSGGFKARCEQGPEVTKSEMFYTSA